MTNRITLDEAYMQMAEVWSKRAYATRAKVGAIIVKDQQIISDGYNGLPKDVPHEEVEYLDGDGLLVTNPEVLHAESNALMKLTRNGSGVGTRGATLYVTLSPCFDCAKLIISAEIKRVVYREKYRLTESLELLARRGVEVVQLHKP